MPSCLPALYLGSVRVALPFLLAWLHISHTLGKLVGSGSPSISRVALLLALAQAPSPASVFLPPQLLKRLLSPVKSYPSVEFNN